MEYLQTWIAVGLRFGLAPHLTLLRNSQKGTKAMRMKQIFAASLLFWFTAAAAPAQDSPAQNPPPGSPAAGQSPRRNGRGEERGQPLAGKITAINSGSLELAKADGTTAAVKLTDKTEFRKDRQPAKIADFKVGDLVFVRAEENSDHNLVAVMIAARSGMGPEGGGRGAGGGRAPLGEMGKDYVAGEIKSVDAPKLTILRTDNVTQTLELNEDTSLHKGRDSVTMADIQPGDHVVARGAVQNNVFVPKNVMILSAEQWQRLQEMGAGRGAAGGVPSNPPASKPPQQ
jgi:hypothetical protein